MAWSRYSRGLDQCADLGPSGREILLLSFPLIPAAVTIAVLRHGLYDVRIVLSRVVVYAVLTAGVIAIYIGLVAVLDRVLRGAGAPVVAALAIAWPSIPSEYACNAWSTAPSAPAATRWPRCPRSDSGWPVTTSAESPMPSRVAPAELRRRRTIDGSMIESGEMTTTSQNWPLDYDGKKVGNLVVCPRQ